MSLGLLAKPGRFIMYFFLFILAIGYLYEVRQEAFD